MSLSPTGPEGFKHVLKFYANFFKVVPKYFARMSCNSRASVANLSPRNFGIFTMRNFRNTRNNVLRVSHDGCATSQLSGEKIKLSDIRTNVMQHSHECCATVVRIKMKISYIPGKVVRLLHDSRKIYFQN